MVPNNGLLIESRPTRRKDILVLTAKLDKSVVYADEVKISKAADRRQFVEAVRKKVPTVPVDELESELLKLSDGSAGSQSDKDGREPDPLESMPEHIREEAESMLADPSLIDRVVTDIEACGVVGEQELALTLYLIGTSRLLIRPLSGIVQGISSTGKSYIIERVALLFPEEAVLKATDISPQALYYLQEGALVHRFVVAGERSRKQDDEHAEATRALREMLSSGALNKVVTIRESGRPEAVRIHQPGPIAFIESTTRATIFDEDANRSLLLATDESPAQTRAINEALALSAMGRCLDASEIIQRHHALQRLLDPVTVIVPFAYRLAKSIPDRHPNARRAFPHVLEMVRAVALLHQRQRQRTDDDSIEAAVADFVVARRLLIGPLARLLGGAVTPAVANFGKRLEERHGDKPFSSTGALSRDPILNSKGKVNEYLRALADVGAAEQVEKSAGGKPAVWKLTGPVPEGGAAWLPTVPEVQEIEHASKLVSV